MAKIEEKPVTASFLSDAYRGSGILLHVSSLPSPYGIGDMGPHAYSWIDRLAESGQCWWQILPLGPTGVGNSPYGPNSTFAGNPLLVSPECLFQDGLLDQGDFSGNSFPTDTVDYDSVRIFKDRLLETAWSNYQTSTNSALQNEFRQFCVEQADWLDDYAHFCALRQKHRVDHYLDFPDKLAMRDPVALEQSRQELANRIGYYRFSQFLFFRQWQTLKQYANRNGIRLIGDLPFFVSPNSADVWTHPESFLLDEQLRPQVVAGVPPDYFSPTGQLWGNPTYNWEFLKRQGYQWWIRRIQALLEQVDVIRLDHFRAFAAAWHIPVDATTAQTGKWNPGPGSDFFTHLLDVLGSLPFLAEDLGLITDDVRELRDQFDLPGTRVLQFAFDGDPNNPFRPDHYIANSVAYTGTHDNNTTRGWYESLNLDEQRVVWQALPHDPLPSDKVADAFIELIWMSKSAIAITPFQDVLNLGEEARMNVPGTESFNWTWRCTEELTANAPWRRLFELTELSGRTNKPRGIAAS